MESTEIIKPAPYFKMYIAVLDEVSDFMVPTLVAHTILSAHVEWYPKLGMLFDGGKSMTAYDKWFHQSYRKCVVKVNRKEFEKIKSKILLTMPNRSLILNSNVVLPRLQSESKRIKQPIQQNESP